MIKCCDFGKAKCYTLSNNNGVQIEILNYGGYIRSWKVPDKDGNIVDIILGYDTFEEYAKDTKYLSCIAGRVCNRIKKGQFTLNNKIYKLAVNNGPNHLHGGIEHFGKKLWTPTVEGNQLVLKCSSKDGEEGYPGNLECQVTFELTDLNELKIELSATSDADTPINLTSHGYYNLGGEGSPNIKDHNVQINADKRLPIDSDHLVTGQIEKVQNEFDLRKGLKIGDLASNPTYDTCYCVNHKLNGDLTQCATFVFWYINNSLFRVKCERNGLELNVWTDQPGVQLYTAEFLDVKGKGGKRYAPHSAFCLETQGYPDSVNNCYIEGWREIQTSMCLSMYP